MKKELISVIIPVYNVEKYLNACVDSVINSDYENLEIILVDDGGTDNCPKMCDDLAKKDKRITVIHKENGGLSSARNAGLDIAKGKYVTFVDSDDIITNNMISTMYSIAEKDNCDIVKTGMVVTGNADVKAVELSTHCVYDKKEALRMIAEKDPSVITICGKLYLMSLFDDLRFPVGMLHEDEYLTPRLFYKCDRIAISESTGYIYMQRENSSIMRSAFSKKRLVIMDIYNDRIEMYKSWGYDDLLFGAYQKYVWSLRYCYDKTKSDNWREEHNQIIQRFKDIDFKYLCFFDRCICFGARFGFKNAAEKCVNNIYKLERRFKQLFFRLKRG